MFAHNLKIAFRNLRKYKTQNIISIIGLAVGFVCFAFSALWIRYEMSYDSFHPKADRIYRVHLSPNKWDTAASNSPEVLETTPYPLVNWLKSNFPEIEDASGIRVGTGEKIKMLYLDYSFCKIFDLPIPEDFFIEGRNEIPTAVIPELYNEETIKILKEDYPNFNYDVQMTIPRWQANTNIQFNVAFPTHDISTIRLLMRAWSFNYFDTYILVNDGVDIEALKEKLDKVDIPEIKNVPVSLVLTPLKQIRYNNPTGNMQSDIKFGHIQIFALAGLLVILCSLFNQLTLYVTRIRMRLYELALRKAHGATNWQIASSLYFDFLVVIVLSLVAGFMLMTCLLPNFKEFANIGINNISIYSELFIYTILLIVSGFIIGGIPILYFRKQVLNKSIKGNETPGYRNLFRKCSLIVQLITCLGMMFCVVVFMKQIRFLHQTNLGINRSNVATVYIPDGSPLKPPYADQIKQIPGIIDAIHVRRVNFLMDMFTDNHTFTVVKEGQDVTYTIFYIDAYARFLDFFEIEVIEGTEYSNDTNTKYVISETVMNDVGKESMSTYIDIIGVARDFYPIPTIKDKPTAIRYNLREDLYSTILYRYEEGLRYQTEQSVTQWLRNEFPDKEEFEIRFTHMEDVFEEYFKSERALLRLLSLMTLACILIAVFGVYSLTSLTCQQRRKEIAIRKVYGAEVIDILNIFFKEYLILLAFAALVAFPAGFLIMKRWLEGYVKQTSMDAWLYVAIFLAVFVVIVFSIFSTVWRAANRNPAEVVKSE